MKTKDQHEVNEWNVYGSYADYPTTELAETPKIVNRGADRWNSILPRRGGHGRLQDRASRLSIESEARSSMIIME